MNIATKLTNGGSGSLGPALLTEDEVHKVLHSYLCGYHQLKLAREEFSRWTVPGASARRRVIIDAPRLHTTLALRRVAQPNRGIRV